MPQGFETIADIASRNIERWRTEMEHPELYRPYPTNLREFDRVTGGIQANRYIVIGGPWKSAKTTLVLHIALAMGNYGKVLYYQLEEGKESMGQRALVHGTMDVDVNDIRDLRLDASSFKDLETSQKMLRGINLSIEDGIDKAHAMIEQADKLDANFVIVDYLQLLNDDLKQVNQASRFEGISRQFITARNQAQATGKKRTFIVVYQLNEEGKAHGTRSIYKDCDGAIEIMPKLDKSRKEPVNGLVELHVLPGRNGMWEGGVKITLGINGAKSLMRDVPEDAQLDLAAVKTDCDDESY